MNDSLVTTYQKLLELEKNKIDKYGLESLDPRSFLSYEEIEQICLNNGVKFQDLLSSDLLVEYPRYGWRTIHFDLIYRLIHIRNLETQPPIPLEYRIELSPEPVPDFGRYKLSYVLSELVPNESVREIIISALNKKYEGLSSHQLPIVKELLSKRSKFSTVAIVAPTASGKTLAFFLPVLIRAVERRLENKAGVSSVLIYPRKALERDHLQSFLEVIDEINRRCEHLITVGIDDGDTLWLKNIRENIQKYKHCYYRGMMCVRCSDYLIIEIKGNSTLVKCSKCSKEYPYLLASKDEIWQKKPTILITNIQTIYRRLLLSSTVRIFAGVDYVVFDEAHIYTDYLGGHVFYIIKLLRHAASLDGSNPRFIFSSATIPNPLDFIAKLAGVDIDEIFYVDYMKTLENIQNIKRRLMLYLYLLPRPGLSVETLTEILILAVTLWCHRHNLKAITFIDSVAEISTLSDYIFSTILGRREGREVIDHLNIANNALQNSYNWLPLAPLIDTNSLKDFVLKEYKESIDIHFGQLRPKKRAEIEYKFSYGPLKLLLSTSTLELGIDLSDVAVIIQHKLPMTPEGVIQRVGRSGRSGKCLRVALGIIVLDSSPLSTLYMFDQRLRGRLADPNLLPPARVGQASASIKLQHTLSLLLYKRALEGKPTFIAGKESLKSKQKVISAIREIISELDEKLLTFNAKVGLFDDNNVLKNQILELKSLFSNIINITKDMDQTDFDRIHEEWEKMLADIEDKTNIIKQILQQIDYLKNKLEKIRELDLKILDYIDSLKYLLSQVNILCSRLLQASKLSYRIGDGWPIQNWYKENFNKVGLIVNQIPDKYDILSNIFKPLNEYVMTVMKGNYKAFEMKYEVDFNELIKVISSIADTLGSSTEDKLVNFIRKLPDRISILQSVNLTELITYKSLKRIENELKIKRSINIIDAINLLLFNRVKFSLLLEPPSPELELKGVEEV
jgi:DEAD/DEAH box helicase domain-containing protein